MSKLFYPRLAVSNLKKNFRIYLPYIFACVIMVMMFYAMGAIGRNSGLDQMRGGDFIRTVMQWVSGVAAGFVVIFLFYTNSFLIKQRRKELGLYQVLGMSRGNLGHMMLWESLITAAVSIGAGLILGLAFGKLVFLIFLKVVHFPVPLDFTIEPEALVSTVRLFAAVFALSLAYNLVSVWRSSPSRLISAAKAGEKEPKGKVIIAVLGAAALSGGYYLAQTAESPLSAVNIFFLAVLLVIAGTYMLFLSGSIVFLKALKKNKNFYYKTGHFTAVSGLLYRMKQNAAGLASICIMSTAVIVVLSICVSLYAGIEDTINKQFPADVCVSMADSSEESRETAEQVIADAAAENGVSVEDVIYYRSFTLPCVINGDGVIFGNAQTALGAEHFSEQFRGMVLLPLADYNRLNGTNISLSDGELLLCAGDKDFSADTEELLLGDKTWSVKERIREIGFETGDTMSGMIGTIYLILPDLESVDELAENYGLLDEGENHAGWTFWFDLNGGSDRCEQMIHALREQMSTAGLSGEIQSKAENRMDVYVQNGGVLFLGVFIGMLFLISTVMIIYYKQISEGYDDRESYQIMQKVGMDQREVRSAIRTQILTVFFLPLAAAVLHVAFAFRVMSMLLSMMYMSNDRLFLLCTAAVSAVFAVFYVIIYAVTSREYYRIVR